MITHFQHAVTLLTDEVTNQTRPGPVLLYFVAESLLDTFFIWSLSCPEYASELKYHQLRCFECLLSHSQHELLFHKQIVQTPVDSLSRYVSPVLFSSNHCSIFFARVNRRRPRRN